MDGSYSTHGKDEKYNIWILNLKGRDYSKA